MRFGMSGLRSIIRVTLVLAMVFPSAIAAEETRALGFSGAHWIWHPDESASTVYLRKVLTFDETVERIEVMIAADDAYELHANGRLIGAGSDWRNPQTYEITRPVARETTAIAIKASNREGAAGLIGKFVAYLRDGSTVVYVTDESWICSDAEETDWHAARFEPVDWSPAASVGAYPSPPWGILEKESWETLRARLAERRARMETAVEMVIPRPQYSTFKGQYLDPDYANLYQSFIKINPKTGLLEYDGQVIRPFFTIYSQPRADGGWILNIPDLDFDLLESDFARMKQAGINVQPRFWNWSELLTADGEWQEVERQPRGRGLPYFRYVYEIYDYFLDRAQTHGLYVNIEPSYYWGLHPEVVPPQYRGKILLYNELWDAANQAYSKILYYFSRRTVIVAIMVGEEDLKFDHCLDEPLMLERFQRHLRRQYGSISNLQRVWTHGYDFDDRSLWERRTMKGVEVLWPEYPFVRGAFDSWKSFEDVRLPVFDYCRSPDSPSSLLSDVPTHGHNLLRDPSWIDFMDLREQIIISRLNDLAGAFRSAAPNHILYYCNPHDFNPPWHMLHCFDRGRLRFDVIGVGQHDSGFEPWEVPHWATSREYIQNTASYAAYTTSSSGPKGFACGEGRGGKSREGTAVYYPWWLADIMGSGGAFFQSYDWNHISGRTYENPTDYDEATLERIGEFLGQTANLPFSRCGEAEVLILRNKHAAYGMSAGYDFGNARYLASILRQLQIPFDILPDSDVMPGDFEPGIVNLNKYRFIFVPAQNQLLRSATWQMLLDWISDPRHAGRRGLSLGLYQDQDVYFNPASPVHIHPAFERLTGTRGFDRRIPVSGETELRYARYFGTNLRGNELKLDFPHNGEIGCFDSLDSSVERILELGDGGPAVVVRNEINGNPVYLTGFYLGMAYHPVWGFEKEQSPYNTLTPFYSAMLTSAGVGPTVSAADNLAVYVADGDSALLIKERFGQETEIELGFKNPSGAVFSGTTMSFQADGIARAKGSSIGAYGTLVIPKAGGLLVSGGREVSSVVKATVEGGLDCMVSGSGKIDIVFELQPKQIYSVRTNGELAMVFTAGSDGRHRMSFDLGDGAQPLHITITP